MRPITRLPYPVAIHNSPLGVGAPRRFPRFFVRRMRPLARGWRGILRRGYIAYDRGKADARRQKLRDEMWHLAADNPLLYRAPAAHRKDARNGGRNLSVRPLIPGAQ